MCGGYQDRLQAGEERPQASLHREGEGFSRMQNAGMGCFLVIILEAFQGGKVCLARFIEVPDRSQRGREEVETVRPWQAGRHPPLLL